MDTSDLIWGHLAASYRKAGRKNDFERAYRTAIQQADQDLKVNSQNADVIAYLGHYHASIGSVKKAMSLTARALALVPDQPHVLITAAETYAYVGEVDLAGPLVAQALEHGYALEALRRSETLRVVLDDPKWKALIEAAASGANSSDR